MTSNVPCPCCGDPLDQLDSHAADEEFYLACWHDEMIFREGAKSELVVVTRQEWCLIKLARELHE